ncbi:MAG: metallophosphoesterase [Methanocellales archaeon]
MKIYSGIEIIEPYPAIYIEDLEAVVIADLHLGYEGIMAEKGIFLPKTQFKKEMEMLLEIFKKKKARRVIINGDIKHEFSETSYHEFKEVRDMLAFLKTKCEEVILIKGNHDNYIARVSNRFGVKLYDELELGDYHFLHGHRAPITLKAKYLIMAHEHPAVTLYDEVGGKEKLNCLLYGDCEYAGGVRRIAVLPAFSTLAMGSEVNFIPKQELLSPILREIDVEKLRVIGISFELGCLDFQELGRLRFI